MMKRLLTGIPLIGCVAVIAYISLFPEGFAHIADDPGLGWHIASGDYIATTGSVPHTDPFLATARISNPYAPLGEMRRWVSEQWLADLIFFKLLASGGWPLLYGVVAGLYLVACFGIAGDGVRRSGAGLPLILLATLLTFKLGQVHLIIRPVIFSIFLFPLVLRWVSSLAAREEFSWQRIGRETLMLGAVFALWANLHPAFVYGLCVLAIAVLSQVLHGLSGRHAAYLSAFKLTVLALGCFCATLINPYGLELYGSIANLGGSAYLRSVTVEWSPIDLVSLEGVLLLVMVLVPLSFLVVSARIRKQLSLFELLSAFFFTTQALWAVRCAPYAGFACLPLWATCFGSCKFFPDISATALTNRVLGRFAQRESTFTRPGLSSSIAIALVGALVIYLFPARVLPGPIGSKYERRLFEVFGLAEVTQLPEGVIFASPDWGGAITHLLAPRYRPVLDDRTVVVGEALYKAYTASLRHPEQAFSELATTFGVTYVLIPPSSALAAYLRGEASWQVRYSSDDLVLFGRQQ